MGTEVVLMVILKGGVTRAVLLDGALDVSRSIGCLATAETKNINQRLILHLHNVMNVDKARILGK